MGSQTFLRNIPHCVFQSSSFSVKCPISLGELVLIELDKKDFLWDSLLEDAWFPSKVEVESPEGDIYTFPIHRWITNGQTYKFREGKG